MEINISSSILADYWSIFSWKLFYSGLLGCFLSGGKCCWAVLLLLLVGSGRFWLVLAPPGRLTQTDSDGQMTGWIGSISTFCQDDSAGLLSSSPRRSGGLWPLQQAQTGPEPSRSAVTDEVSVLSLTRFLWICPDSPVRSAELLGSVQSSVWFRLHLYFNWKAQKRWCNWALKGPVHLNHRSKSVHHKMKREKLDQTLFLSKYMATVESNKHGLFEWRFSISFC